MAEAMRIRAAITSGNLAEVRFLIRHPMESGFRTNKSTGKVFPAHYVQSLKVTHKDRTLFDAQLGTAVSTNPLFHLKFKGAATGDTVTVTWKDNKGESRSDSATIG